MNLKQDGCNLISFHDTNTVPTFSCKNQAKIVLHEKPFTTACLGKKLHSIPLQKMKQNFAVTQSQSSSQF